jgi:hypothetical protein
MALVRLCRFVPDQYLQNKSCSITTTGINTLNILRGELSIIYVQIDGRNPGRGGGGGEGEDFHFFFVPAFASDGVKVVSLNQ